VAKAMGPTVSMVPLSGFEFAAQIRQRLN